MWEDKNFHTNKLAGAEKVNRKSMKTTKEKLVTLYI